MINMTSTEILTLYFNNRAKSRVGHIGANPNPWFATYTDRTWYHPLKLNQMTGSPPLRLAVCTTVSCKNQYIKQIEFSSIPRHQHLPLQNFLSTLSAAALGALSCLCSNSLLCFSTSACLLSLFPSPGWLLSWIFGELLLLSLPCPIEPPVGLDPVSFASLDLAPPDCAEASSGDLPEPPFVGPAPVPCPSEGGSGPGCSACCFVPLEAPCC
jgi:hypothetical protein